MQIKEQGIVIARVPYGDSAVIVNVFTRSKGLTGYFIPGARKAKSKTKFLYLNPLSTIEFVVSSSNKSNLPRIQQVEPVVAFHRLFDDPVKQTVIMFMAEVLGKCLTEGYQDEKLYGFLEEFLLTMNENDTHAASPIVFLMGLSDCLGFYPDDSPNPIFSLDAGCFIDSESSNSSALNEFESALMRKCLAKDLTSFTNAERAQLLEIWLQYFDTHQPGSGRLKSVEIIRSILRD